MVSAARVVLAVALVAVGAGLVYWGRKRYLVYRLVTGTPTTSVGEITDAGLVEVTGEVVADETLPSPVRGDECVLGAWLAEEYQRSGRRTSWNTIAAGIESVPFRVDDGTGEVVVDVGSHAEGRNRIARLNDLLASEGVAMNGVICELDRFARVLEVGVEEDPPERLREFVASSSAIGRARERGLNLLDVGPTRGDRRYSEGSVAPGDEVYLLGYARPAVTDEFAGPKWSLGPPPDDVDDAVTVVSTAGKSALVVRAKRGIYAIGVGALLAFGGGLVLMQPYTPYF